MNKKTNLYWTAKNVFNLIVEYNLKILKSK